MYISVKFSNQDTEQRTYKVEMSSMLKIVENPNSLVDRGYLDPGDYVKVNQDKFSLARRKATTLVLKCLQLSIIEPCTQMF